jgi:alpha-L-rhamnosidase
VKVILDHNPLAPSNLMPADFRAAYQSRPAWITPRHPSPMPDVTAYRLAFHLPQAATMRIHVSADERYLLFVDGELAGRGPERGSDRIWYYETHDLTLSAGPHSFVALVWRLGKIGPLAQVSLEGGFLLDAEGQYADLISTKSAPWETKPVTGISFSMPDLPRVGAAWFVEPIQTTDGSAYPWGIESGAGEGWEPAAARREDFVFPFGILPTHILKPAPLPAQMAVSRGCGRVRHVANGEWTTVQSVSVVAGASLGHEVESWQNLLDVQQPLIVPPHSRRQVIIDLEEYVCAYPQITLSGGNASQVILGWAEALFVAGSETHKAQRDEVEGRTFNALCRDVVLTDGGEHRTYEPLWWRAGRYIELLIETNDQALTVETLGLVETRYPLEMESHFASSDKRLDGVIPLALRGLQMCAHETFMDCPYYEQMMYIGDSRLEALTTYTLSSDDRLPRKAITLFGLSRLPDGLVQARYPGRDVQLIPPFALWWAGMVYDHALWRGDSSFVVQMLPGMRAVLDNFLSHLNPENLLQAPDGWNFSDWVDGWPIGVPPDGFKGFSGLLNWHLVYTLKLAARLEEWAGESQFAERWQIWQDRIAAAAKIAFWDEQRGLFADDLAHQCFSEHTQCLALLSGPLAQEQFQRTAQSLLKDETLTRTTIYFNHYLFETYHLLGHSKPFFSRLGLWFDLPAQGFKTTPEQPEPTRSDCHGWGAHPLYHYFASVLGIRPLSFGFDQVEIAPMPGQLTNVSGRMVHPRGWIEADLTFDNGHMRGTVTLPEGITGLLQFSGQKIDLHPGPQTIEM